MVPRLRRGTASPRCSPTKQTVLLPQIPAAWRWLSSWPRHRARLFCDHTPRAALSPSPLVSSPPNPGKTPTIQQAVSSAVHFEGTERELTCILPSSSVNLVSYSRSTSKNPGRSCWRLGIFPSALRYRVRFLQRRWSGRIRAHHGRLCLLVQRADHPAMRLLPFWGAVAAGGPVQAVLHASEGVRDLGPELHELVEDIV